MIKKIIGITILVLVVAVLAFGAINRTIAKSETTVSEFGSNNAHGNASTRSEINPTEVKIDNSALEGKEHDALLDTQPTGVLDQVEIDALQFMLEEEKLARDVYSALYVIWGQPVFSNISNSEQTHMNAILDLLNRYELVPLASEIPGTFHNTDLQALYSQLIAQGNQSLTDAFLVGGAIEEIDILDLQERIAQTDQVDILSVFENLRNGSINHLNAFASQYSRQTGSDYQAQFLNTEEYQNIINQNNGNGRGRGGNNRDNQGN